MFSLSFYENTCLPKLAWLAEVDTKSQNVSIYHGAAVECHPDFFVAGAWAGEFDNAEFDKSALFCGTGGKLSDDSIVFVTPSHALERLISTKKGGNFVVSNSLPFLMSYAELNLDRSIDQYERLFCSILDGPQKMIHEIPMQNGNSIIQYIVSTISVSEKGIVDTKSRIKHKPFIDFYDYENSLVNAVLQLRKNSLSPSRKKTQYGIVSTMSSGYDSPACSSIAQKAGCKTSVSLIGGKYDSDDGRDIARQLGIENIISRNMYDYRNYENEIDAEFLAGGELGTMLQFSVFDDVFQDSLVFFGLRGSYWDITASMTEDYEMIGYFNCESDASITENALKNGFLAVPLPTFGASACSSIFKISASEEMKRWSIGGTYDKPIPRRILEQAGVKRESFGQIKYGGGFSFSRDNKKRLSTRMSREGYQSFIAYVNAGKGIKKSARRTARCALYFLKNFPSYWKYALSKLHINSKIKQKPERMANPGIVADLLFWGTDMMKDRYSQAMVRFPHIRNK